MKPSDISLESSINHAQSHIPRLQRSASLRLNGERSLSRLSNIYPQRNSSIPPKIPCGLWRLNHKHSGCNGSLRDQTPSEPTTPDDDKSSVKSFGSCATFMSCDLSTHQQLESPCGQIRDGKKYVLHCQRHVQTVEEYLTPTQRKDRQIRQLRAALLQAKRKCEEKESKIDILKSEVEELHFVLSQSNITSDGQSHLDDGIQNTKTTNKDNSQANSTLEEDSISCPTHSEQNPLEDSGILADLAENRDFSQTEHIENENEKEKVPDHEEHASQGSRASSCKLFCSQGNNNSEMIDKCQYMASHNSFPSYYNDENSSLTRGKCQQGNDDKKYYREDSCFGDEEKRSTLFNIKPLTDNFTLSKRKMYLLEENNLVLHYEREVEQIKRNHAAEYQELKEKYNDRIENLLQKLSEANARYLELRPAFDGAQDRIRQLETQLENTRKEMAAQEDWHKQMYLKMYRKGQEAAKFEHADEVLEFAHRAPKRVSVPELLQQLHHTEHELEQTKQMYRCELYQQATKGGKERQSEYTLRFLKDAMYYFLTEKDNKGHLQAIESILGFNEAEKIAVSKSLKHRRL